LDVSSAVLLAEEAEVVATPHAFVASLAKHLQETGKSVQDFSSTVGWNVEPMLDDPSKVGDLNADGFRAICEAIGLNWLTILDQIKLSSW
jgi:hypothetical protein